jgi:hypothetical protein
MADAFTREIGRQKDQWREDFRATRIEITRLQNHLTELKRKLIAADEILATAKLKNKSATGKYTNMGLRQAIRSFFVEHRYTQHSVSELKSRLEHEGMKTDARDLRANISIVCRRLENTTHFLVSEMRNGVRVYRLADQNSVSENTSGEPVSRFPAKSVS